MSFTLKPKVSVQEVTVLLCSASLRYVVYTRYPFICTDQGRSRQHRRTQATSSAIATVLHDTELITNVSTETGASIPPSIPQKSTSTVSTVLGEVREGLSAPEEEDSESDSKIMMVVFCQLTCTFCVQPLQTLAQTQIPLCPVRTMIQVYCTLCMQDTVERKNLAVTSIWWIGGLSKLMLANLCACRYKNVLYYIAWATSNTPPVI